MAGPTRGQGSLEPQVGHTHSPQAVLPQHSNSEGMGWSWPGPQLPGAKAEAGGLPSRQSSNRLQPRPAACTLAPSSPDQRSSHVPAARAAWEYSILYSGWPVGSAGMGSGQPQPKPLLPPAASVLPLALPGGGCQSQGPPWPGPWVWPYLWAPHLPRVLESECWHRVCDGSHSSGGWRQEQSPLAPGPQRHSG